MLDSRLPSVISAVTGALCYGTHPAWIALLIGIGAGLPLPAIAQITPDRTLGSESSRIVETRIRNQDSSRIDGGAIRGSHLFHSFSEFNVGDGRGAYFSNPAGIEAILGRVTGEDVSDIFGTLGVLGNADLYLLNPNGFVFGENARLDVRGSFVASTADRFTFPDGSSFSAVNPDAPPLLTVALTPGLQHGSSFQGPVTNHAALTVAPEQTLMLGGTITTHRGTLTAPGGSVQVLGDQVNLLGNALIDVSSDVGGGNIVVGGNLRGDGPLPNAQRTVIAPGVTLRADALTAGNGGHIVVWADGLTQFYGDISAQGGVQGGDGGFAEVSGKQHLVFNGHADLSAPQGTLGTLLLDPENIIIADEDTSAGDMDVLDGEILAEDNPGETVTISSPILEGLAGDAEIILEATNDIIINDLASDVLIFAVGDGSITFTADADRNNVGDFTMLDTNDILLTGGRDITITGSTLTPGSINSEGGTITLEASDRLLLNGVELNSGSFADIEEPFADFSGDITLTAANDILFTNAFITSDVGAIADDAIGDAGFITIQSTNGSIVLDATEISSSTPTGFAGDILMTAGNRISLDNDSTIRSNFENFDAIEDFDDPFSEGGGAGIIRLTATNDVTVTNASQIQAESIGADVGTLEGDISIESAQGSILLNGSNLSARASDSGFAGNIFLSALQGTVTLENNSIINSDFENEALTGTQGGAGAIEVIAEGDVAIADSTISSASLGLEEFDPEAPRGDVTITSNVGDITLSNAQLRTDVNQSNGFAGTITLTASQGSLTIDENSTIASDFSGFGEVGFDDGEFANGAEVSGGAGQILLTAQDDVAIANASISADSFSNTSTDDPDAEAPASGNIAIQSTQGSVLVTDETRIATIVDGSGRAGDIQLLAGDAVSITDSFINSNFENFSDTGEVGGAGSIQLTGQNEVAIANSRVTANSFDGGTEGIGSIDVRSTQGSITLSDNSRLETNVRNNGFAGDITLSANNGGIALRNSSISSDFNGDGFASGDAGGAGFIQLSAGDTISLRGGATAEGDDGNERTRRAISASSFGSFDGRGGDIQVESTGGTIRVRDANVIATASGDSGEAGIIRLLAEEAIAITENSRIRSDANGPEARGGTIRLRVASPDGRIAVDNSRIRSDANGGDGAASGTSGSVRLIAPGGIRVRDSRLTSTSQNDDENAQETGNVILRSRRGRIIVDRTTLSTTNSGEAIAGDIELDAPNIIRLLNSTLSSDGREGIILIGQRQTPMALEVRTSTLSTTNASAPGRNSGNIEIMAGTLFTDSAIVRTNAGGVSEAPFEGGSIDINVDETIELVNSRISSDAAESADGGSITFNAGTSIVLTDSTITSNAASNLGTVPPQIGDEPSPSSPASAQAVLTPAIDLAIPNEFGNGGDIALTLPTESGVLLLENGSRISTNAGSVPPGSTGGNGGNITIDTNVITAEILGNNDITANSVNNNGGIIDIIAPGGIFGMIQRTREDLIDLLGTEDESQLDPRFVPTSDITAISQAGTGLSGIILLETPDVAPEQGNLDVPSSFDNTPILTSACDARIDADTAQRSEFVRTGRGGIPPAPNDPIDGSRPRSPWVERHGAAEEMPAEEAGDRPSSQRPELLQEGVPRPALDAIIEAQGWRVDATGKTTLVAQQPQSSANQASSHSSRAPMFYPACMPSSHP